MWQRKQTIFLAAAAAALIIMIFFPIWVGSSDEATYALYPLHFTTKTESTTTTTYYPYCLTAIAAIAAATLAIYSIGKFSNRLLQIKMGTLNSLLMACAMGGAAYFSSGLIKEFQISGQYSIGLYLPAVAMACNMIANWLIRRDERLVRNAERLR